MFPRIPYYIQVCVLILFKTFWKTFFSYEGHTINLSSPTNEKDVQVT